MSISGLQPQYFIFWRRNSAQDEPFSENLFSCWQGASQNRKSRNNDPSESGRKAQTWFFQAFVRLKDGQTFSNLLDSSKQQLETSLTSASMILWACADTTPLESQDSNCVILEGFVHALTKNRLGSLKRVLLKKLDTDAAKSWKRPFKRWSPAPARTTCVTPRSRHFLKKPRWILSLRIKASG